MNNETTKTVRWVWFILLLPYLLRLILVWQDFELLVKRSPLLEDDFFYYLNIARNILSGNGVTADGQTATTGFQMLHEVLCIIISAPFSPSSLLPFHFILSLQVIISFAAMLVLYDLVKKIFDERKAIVACVLFSWWIPLLRHGNNGMETSLQILFLFLILRAIMKLLSARTNKNATILGVFLAIAIFVRVDMLAVSVALITSFFFFRVGNKNQSLPTKQILLVGIIPFVAFVCYCLLNFFINQHFFPDSGTAVRELAKIYGGEQSFLSLSIRAFVVLLNDQPLVQVFQFVSMGNVVSILLSGLIGIASLLFVFMRRKIFSAEFRQLLLIMVVYAILLFVFYVAYVPAYWFFSRYLFPISLMTLIIVAYVVDEFGLMMKRINEKLFLVLALCAFLFFVAPFGLRWYRFMFDEVQTISEKELRGKNISETSICHNYDIAKWLAMNVPQGKNIAMWQGGLVSFVTHRNILHLDGVVNRDALEARKQHRLDEYLKERDVNYFVDFQSVAKFVLENAKDAEHSFRFIGKSNCNDGNVVVLYEIVK